MRVGGNNDRKTRRGQPQKSGEVPNTNFELGQRVSHETFGEGVILNYEGEGPNARVEVNFGPNKTKWLMVSYAKLTPL